MNVAASTIGATSTYAIEIDRVLAARKRRLQQLLGAGAREQSDGEPDDRQHESLPQDHPQHRVRPAPIAIRMPISFVRRLVVYATRP